MMPDPASPRGRLHQHLDGVITVYLSIITLLIISMVLVCLESARTAVIKTSVSQYSDIASEMVFSGYVKPLADRYGLFLLDTGGSREYSSWFETYLKMNLEKNSSTEKRAFSLFADIEKAEAVSDSRLPDSDWKVLLEEIRRCELYGLGTQGIKTALNAFKKSDIKYAGSVTDDFRKSVEDKASKAEAEEKEAVEKEAEEEAAGQRQSESAKDQSGTAEKPAVSGNGSAEQNADVQNSQNDPRPGIGRWIRSGILNLVMGDEAVSSMRIDSSDCSYKTGSGSTSSVNSDFLDYKKISKELEDSKLSGNSLPDQDAAGAVSDNPDPAAFITLLNLYIMDRFDTLTKNASQSSSNALNYEVEYILWGKSSDRENLENTMSSICAVRTALNLAYLYTDSGSMAQVSKAVTSLAAAALPAAGALIQLLILACWAGAEAVVDCAALSEGGKVPLWKNSSTWNLSFSQMTGIASGGGGARSYVRSKDKGLDYSQYLTLLLASVPKEKKIIRMLQLIEKNVRLENGYSDFKLKNCITGARFEVSADIKGKFFTRPSAVKYNVNSQYGY